MKPEILKNYFVEGVSGEPVCLKTTQQRTKQPDELAKIIQAFQPNDGWVVLQSDVIYFYDNNLGELNQQDGIFNCIVNSNSGETSLKGHFINAEMVNASSDQSLHIVEDGEGGWIITTYHEEADAEPNTLMDKSHLLAKKRHEAGKQPKINYSRYWKHSPNKGYHILAARFTGYSHGEDLS